MKEVKDKLCEVNNINLTLSKDELEMIKNLICEKLVDMESDLNKIEPHYYIYLMQLHSKVDGLIHLIDNYVVLKL